MQTADRLKEVQEYYFSVKRREICDLEKKGKKVLNLGIGSPDLLPPDPVIEQLKKGSGYRGANQYQPYQGLSAFREAIAEFSKTQMNVIFNPDDEILPHAHEWFDMGGLEESPFMMYAVDALPHTHDKIPAILHVDNTCRVQTVGLHNNANYYHLIDSFYQLTDVPILFNSSFNLSGEPLVETPDDAIDCFECSDIDYLYFPEVQKLRGK
mgnify:CR=1 FL=1